MESQYDRLMGMTDPWFVAVNEFSVNLDDLLNLKPGGIVRCTGSPGEAIKLFVPPQWDALGCVAGWISEE